MGIHLRDTPKEKKTAEDTASGPLLFIYKHYEHHGIKQGMVIAYNIRTASKLIRARVGYIARKNIQQIELPLAEVIDFDVEYPDDEDEEYEDEDQ